MQVLRIRGQNLNSLERFEVDLTQAPLADAGLFAITGETGAGKTTLLDALTLALYGDYPRIADAGGGLAPDPSGERISGGDPRSILRRGTGSGFAEVDFIGVDGAGYRVRWSVARARGRVDGNPQQVGRALYRLSDDGAVAQGKRDVNERIAALTGLDFGQFRRTVLLAQGEFDAFLMASENDRAALLQRITDTGIYSRLSSRVHDGLLERRDKASNLRQRLDVVGVMLPEDRAALETDLASIRALGTELSKERATLAPAIESATQVARAREAIELAVLAQGTATVAMEAGADERVRLGLIDAVEPLRALAVERRRADEETVRAAGAQEEAEKERLRLETAVREASVLSVETERKAVERDRAVETSMPVWTEAMRLDLELARAERDERSAVALETKTAQHHALARAQVEAKRSALIEIAGRRDDILGRLTDTVGHEVLAGDAGRIEHLFAAHDEAVTRRDVESAAMPKLHVEKDAAEGVVETADAARRTLLDERDRVDRGLSELKAARAALDLPALSTRRAALEGVGALLVEHSRDHRRHDLAAARMASTAIERAETLARGALAETRRAEAEATLRDKEAERRGLGMAVERASGAASHAAATLRALLAEGEPCPVCGSTEHHAVASADLERLAKELRDGMDVLSREIQDGTEAVVAAAARVSTARVEETDAGRRMAELDGDMAEARGTFVARGESLTQALSACGIAGSVPGLEGPWVREAWVLLSDGIAEARAPVLKGMAEGDRLSGEIDDATERRDEILARVEALSTEITTGSNQAQSVALRIAAAEARLDSAIRAAQRSAESLAPYLAAAELSADRLANASSESARIIAGLGKERMGVRREAIELESLTTSATLALEDAEKAAQDAFKADTDAAAVAIEAKRALSDWLNRRSELLGGEDAATHRTRTEAAARDARSAAAAARTAHALAVAKAGAAVDRHADAIAVASSARDAATAAAQVLADACVHLGHPKDRVIAWLDTARDAVERLRDSVATLVQAVRDAEGVVTTRRDDLDRAVAAMAGVELPEDAARRLVALDTMIDGHTRSFGAMEERIRSDDGRRVLAQVLEGALAVVMTDLTVWAEVDDAIGSASGDRFARLAQEITLEALVGLANEQLAVVAPRYRLARGEALALHVADLEMGGELRASRSLSGGERFLVSLGLALALSGLEGRQGHANVLFIDEGFGSLDAASLDVAIEALETLQALGRKVAVVTHVAAMIERIPTQVRVTKRGGGRSVVTMVAGS